jgi:hypothetical protein
LRLAVALHLTDVPPVGWHEADVRDSRQEVGVIRRVALSALFLLGSLTPVAGAPATFRIEGLVRSGVSKAPIPNATVRVQAIQRGYGPQGRMVFDLKTSPDGKFSLEVNPESWSENRFYILACKDGFVEYPPRVGAHDACFNGGLGPTKADESADEAFERSMGIIIPTAGRVAHVVIDLAPGGLIRAGVSVRTPTGIRPFTRGSARLENSDFPASRAADPDDHGRVEFPNLAASNAYSLSFFPSGYVRQRVTGVEVSAGQSTAISPVLDQSDPTGVRGLVRVAGQPASRGDVALRRLPLEASAPAQHFCSTSLEADGSYECRGVAPGSYDLEVMTLDPNGDVSQRAKHVVAIEALQTTINNFDLPASSGP